MILLKDLLFDTPIWLLAILLLPGVAFLLTGLRSRQLPKRNAGLICLGITLVLVILNFTFETDKQICIRQTHQLVTAVEHRDVNAIANLLHEQARLYAWDKGQIVSQAKVLADAYHVDALKVTSISAKQLNRDEIDVRVSVTTASGWGGVSIPTNWDLTWIHVPGAWRLTNIELEDARIGPGLIEAYLKILFMAPPK